MKVNKEIITKLCASFVLFVLLTMGLYATIRNKDKNNNIDDTSIPEIKENYTSTTLEKYLEYNSKIKYINNRFEIENNNERYYLYYDNNTISYEKINELKINKNYTIQTNEKTNQQYIINNKNNTISDMYDSITEITFDNKNYSYLLLSIDEKNSIMNLETDEIIELDEEIKYIADPYNYINNKKIINNKNYLITVNDNKYGVIDYNGNTILELKYDYIRITNNGFIIKENNKFGIINNNEFILEPIYQDIIEYKDNYVIKKDNKYAIINKDKELIIHYEIDYVEKIEDYLIIIKNNRLGIFKDNQITLDYQIETKNNQINAYIYNSNIHINTYNNTTKTYIINNNKIKKTINNELKTINITDYKTLEPTNILNKYTYTTEIKDNKLLLTIYDSNYDKYYENTIELKNKTNDIILTKNYSNENFKLNIEYDSSLETYYFDLNKRIVLNEYNAISNYLENGYKFTLNDNHELRIYKDEELISKHNNIEYYIGGYYFSGTNGVIYKLEFKKEAKK